MARFKIATGEIDIEFKSIGAEDADKFYRTLKARNSPAIEEILFKSIVLNEDLDIDSLPAGIVSTILYCAFKLSGFVSKDVDIPDNIERFREILSHNFYYTMYSSIIKTQPSYKLEELKTKSFNELMELFVLSEIVMGKDIANVAEMRKLMEQQAKNMVSPSAGGVGSVTPEEIELVKGMISAEEFNQELF